MANPNRKSIITDIVIPENLLRAPTADFHRRSRQKELAISAAEHGPVRQAIDAHYSQIQRGDVGRTLSIAVTRPEPALVEDGDRKFLSSQSVTTDETASDNEIQVHVPTVVTHIQFADDVSSPNTNLFNSLNTYSMNEEGSGQANIYTEKDPRARNSVHPRWSPTMVSQPLSATCKRTARKVWKYCSTKRKA
ncbi:hypothetical protein QQX98_004122 [Neonectria punicea]|uniref:Uncharacterized protein n=1 Tax=Neonectria punicea TaxID=979145 RepID=A0ABR1HB39_9HYPO